MENKDTTSHWYPIIYNQFHNILRLHDILPIIPFTTSETMGDYYF